jgi:hypothetical protein
MCSARDGVCMSVCCCRCGMVYMEPDALGVEPLLASWLARLPAALKPHQQV